MMAKNIGAEIQPYGRKNEHAKETGTRASMA
jgi:hypothetical protein